ncbi:MAG TPA: hypothetical protein VJZ91_02550 [Blastocatellia bacterium]|nr:hypothetical protein [Blastocatellia bacterium]
MKMKSFLLVASVLVVAAGAPAQERNANRLTANTAAVNGSGPAINTTPSPSDLARQAFTSHGGEKFRNLKSLSLFGTVEVYYGSNPSRSSTSKFAMVQAGDRARTDIESADSSYREIYDGKRPYSTVNAGSVWAPTKFGMPVLARFDQAGYTVTALADEKNARGFRITDAEGNATDFFVDQATGRVMLYTFEYHTIKFVFEHKSFKDVDGVLVPTSFLRKMVLPRVDVYMEFKVKDAKVNQPIGDDVFIIPERKS